MGDNYLYAIVILIGFIGVSCVFIVVKIAKERELDLKRWIFYGVFFHVFALCYLLFKGGKDHHGKEGYKPNGIAVNK